MPVARSGQRAELRGATVKCAREDPVEEKLEEVGICESVETR